MAKRCPHNWGWSLLNNTHIFIFPKGGFGKDKHSGFVEFGHNKRNKLMFVCNLSCGAYRNIYLSGKVKTFGKIHLSHGPCSFLHN